MVYQTNADWHSSYEALVTNPLMKADRTKKGLIQFWFKDNPTLFMLAPTGKLQVKWNDIEEKKILFRLIKNLLVSVPNEELVITPLKQQLWIDYPVPNTFKVYWCDQSSEFALKKPLIPKKEENPSQFSLGLKKVMLALDELRHEFRFLREPTFNEIAIKASCLDKHTVDIALRLKSWKEDKLDDAKWIAERTLNLAAWLRYKDCGEGNSRLLTLSKTAINSASLDAIKRAQVVLKNYPDLVPKIGSNALI